MVDNQDLSPLAGDLAGWRFRVPHVFQKSQRIFLLFKEPKLLSAHWIVF
jgi:hypothetical protein